MKKLTLIALFALSTLCSFSQDFTVKVYQVDVMTYDAVTDDYTLYKSYYPERMKVTKSGNVFIVNNEDESNYRIGKKLSSSVIECMNFMGTDKDDEEVGIQFCLYQSENRGTMTVLYLEKMAVIYYLRPSN